MMFKPGSYITGTDRSYQRSIYQVVDLATPAPKEHSARFKDEVEYGFPLEGELCVKTVFKGLYADPTKRQGRTITAAFADEHPLYRFDILEARGQWKGFEEEFRFATGEELAEVGILI